jgi:hypothetical protein
MSKKIGKFKRVCALKTCRKPFTTDDERKVYHSRACGNKQRSKRWYQAAAEALRSLRKGSKKAVASKPHKARKAKPARKSKPRKMAKPAAQNTGTEKLAA